MDQVSPRSAALGKVRGKNQRRSRKPKAQMMGGVGPCAGGGAVSGAGVNAPGATGGVGMMVGPGQPGQQQLIGQQQHQQQAMQQHQQQQQQNQMGMPNMGLQVFII